MGGCDDHRCECKKGVSRRELIQIGAGAAAAGVLARGGMAVAAQPGHFPPTAQTPPPQEWFDTLFQRGEAPAYTGESLKNVALPLGGLGTGTIWLHGSGRLTAWQIFNNINKATQVDDTFFAVRIEQDGKPPVVRALQLNPIGPFKGMESVRFVGQYPFAFLEFSDPALPIRIQVQAFNPMIPLDDKNSGLPAAVFRLYARNTSNANLRVSFLASLQNAVGHQGKGASVGVTHATYGRNVNKLVRSGSMVGVAMHAEPGIPAELDRPLTVRLDHNLLSPADAWPIRNLTLRGLRADVDDAGSTLFFLSKGDIGRMGGGPLAAIANAIQAGATLVLAGSDNPLLRPVAANAPADARRNEIVFADFEDPTYRNWKAEGEGFGAEPAHGTQPGQNPVSGFLGGGLVNTFNPNDGPQGRLLSPPFRIERPHIAFLIGGGSHPGKTCMNLRVDNQIVRTAAGKDDETLTRQNWDVKDLIGKEGVLEIVDHESGGWGHINVDDIRFTNMPVEAVTPDEAAAWNAVVPAFFDAPDPKAKKQDRIVAIDRSVPELAATTADRIRFSTVAGRKPSRTQHNPKTLLSFEDGAPAMLAATVGKGRVFVMPADVLGLDESDPVRQRDAVMSLLAGLAGVRFTPAAGRPNSAPSFGTMCLATYNQDLTYQTGWSDRQKMYDDFAADGDLSGSAEREGPTAAGSTINAAIATSLNIGPGAGFDQQIVLAWHFPNQYYPQDSWRVDKPSLKPVGNMYANWFHDAASAATYVVGNLGKLTQHTETFRERLYESSLPHYLVDCIGANASILRGPTCFWIKDGTFYGFEGCGPGGGGCCPMNCNHVWNYEHTLSRLWPALERNMRETELVHHQLPEGGVHHRVGVPRENTNRSGPVADGQCGAVLKAYREHLQSASGEFLAKHWPRIRKAMDFAISNWDANADGVMDKPQFNTYDRDIFGLNTFITSLYLAALRAAEEMARLSGDAENAARYRKLFESGRDFCAKNLFDGEHYIQKADNLAGGYGIGCCADQVVGQWWARVLNLGDILPNEQVQSSLKAIFKYCWLTNMNGFEGTQRFLEFANREDKGLLIAAWPKGGRPDDPIYYRDEMWTGVEYQVASHKIYEGQFREALAIVKGARERYAGRNKNPWNEIECGDYYARAMSSWALLLAVQGYFYDGPAKAIGFAPKLTPDDHRSFFSAAQGWGRFEQKRESRRQTNRLEVAWGRLELLQLRLELPKDATKAVVKATGAGKTLAPKITLKDGRAVLAFKAPIVIEAGQSLDASIEWA